MTRLTEHPALSKNENWLVCANPTCATVLASDAEICDECGGTQFDPLSAAAALLCGWADNRPVVFQLKSDHPLLIGRSLAGGPAPDIDLRRFPSSASVHRRHATIERQGHDWRVSHLGTNPLVVRGRERLALEPGASAAIRSGQTLEVGGVALLLLVRDLPRRI